MEFKVTQSSSDAQILFYIKKNLNFGQVSVQDKYNKTHHFRVRDKDSLLKIIHLFNGYLYTAHRQNQFRLWLEAYNSIYGTLIPYKQTYGPETAWLCGFTDAEGCFTVSLLKRSDKYTQVQVRYILSQKNEKKLFLELAEEFGGKIHYLKSYDGYNWVINLMKLKKIIKYFTKYKLKTKKILDYRNWIYVYNLVIEKEHLTDQGLRKITNKLNKKKSNKL